MQEGSINEVAQRIAEVIESATERFTAQCYRLYEAPPLGTLVRAGGEAPVYGVVASIATTSLDPGRRVIARGAEEATEEDVYRSNPQLERLLRTDFQATVVGHSANGTVRHGLPPLPPHIHAFVFTCLPKEVCQFTEDLDFLSLLIGQGTGVADEVAAAYLRQAATAHQDAEAFLVRAGRELATLLGGDIQRLNAILRRLAL